MTSRTQQERAELPNTPPPDNQLLPGQLYVELADPVKLWTGVPVSLSSNGKKPVFDSTAYLKTSGGTMTGDIVLAGNPASNMGAVPKSYVDSAAGNYVPLAGGTMTGPLVLNADPTQAKGAVTKQYSDTKLALAGGTMTGPITLAGNPVAPLQPATKQYADTFLPLAGGTLTGPLTLNADPTTNLGAATKQYVDNNAGAVAVSDTPPVAPKPGSLWWDSADGNLYIQYQDPNTSQFVRANSGGIAEAPVDGNVYARTNAAWTGIGPATAAAPNNTGRNLVHNGQFNVAQRGAGPFTGPNGTYTLDRWQLGMSTDAVSITSAATTDADRAGIGDEQAEYTLANTFTGNASAGAYHFIQQKVEDIRRLSGKTVTLSFWAKAASGTPKLGINGLQYFGSGGSPSASVQLLTTGTAITISTSWARYTTTIAIPSASGKTMGTNNDASTSFQFWYSSGATNNTIAGNIGVQSGTVQIWGVQLEIGSVATPLAKRDPADDLALCQRFYISPVLILLSANGTSGGNFASKVDYPVQMRAAPTFNLLTNASSNVGPPIFSAWGGLSAYVATTATATGLCSLNLQFSASADL